MYSKYLTFHKIFTLSNIQKKNTKKIHDDDQKQRTYFFVALGIHQ